MNPVQCTNLVKNQSSIQTNNQNSQKLQISEYKMFQNLLCFKGSFFICRQDDMNLLLLFNQPSFFNALTTAVDSFRHSLKTGLLLSAISCALFNTSQVILKSMFLSLRPQTYFESFVMNPMLVRILNDVNQS